MSIQPQEGIYYRSKPPIGNSFCMLSLRAPDISQIKDVGFAMSVIWKHIELLKKGIVFDLNIDMMHRRNGNLTALVGYSSNIFETPGSQKRKPKSFGDFNFKSPGSTGGGNIIDHSLMTYSPETVDNHLLSDHIILQLIADSDFYTNRAAVEVWKALHRLEKTTGKQLLRITSLYTGFQRPDNRNWLGFHDGVSNLNSRERPYVIYIKRDLNSNDSWTFNGTYLAFMRISLDIERWQDTEVQKQELLIGRDKLTGCPLVGLDKKGKPVKDFRCPVPGTTEVIDTGNEKFRERTTYGTIRQDRILQHSHIAHARPIKKLPIWDKKSLRIFRQGFEFLVPSVNRIGLVPGLNFVSFQNTPERLFRALIYQQTILEKGVDSTRPPSLDNYMSVLAAGIFFVPPRILNSPFPGAQIFFNNKELSRLPNIL